MPAPGKRDCREPLKKDQTQLINNQILKPTKYERKIYINLSGANHKKTGMCSNHNPANIWVNPSIPNLWRRKKINRIIERNC